VGIALTSIGEVNLTTCVPGDCPRSKVSVKPGPSQFQPPDERRFLGLHKLSEVPQYQSRIKRLNYWTKKWSSNFYLDFDELGMSMLIFSGIVGEIGQSGAKKGSLWFTLGEPPVTFYSPGPGSALFKPGDYVAIAAKRTFMPGVQHVALAYRNWGTKGSSQTIGAVWPSLCLGVGAVGAYFVYEGALKDSMNRPGFRGGYLV
jgi:hypothetical protein